MNKHNAPSKELCLRMAEIQHDQHNEKSMWLWLIAYGFYDMYLEGWFQ